MYVIDEKLLSNRQISCIMFDVDGVVKDLYLEHTEALEEVVKGLAYTKKLRTKIILKINSFTKPLIASGIIPTSSAMQKIMLFVYAIFLCENPRIFYQEYKECYAKKTCMFEDMIAYINGLATFYNIMFISMNSQSKDLSKYGLFGYEIFVSKNKKQSLIRQILEEKGIQKEEILVVGDNYIHDYIPAKWLKVDVIIIDSYDNKFKQKIKKTAL